VLWAGCCCARAGDGQSCRRKTTSTMPTRMIFLPGAKNNDTLTRAFSSLLSSDLLPNFGFRHLVKLNEFGDYCVCFLPNLLVGLTFQLSHGVTRAIEPRSTGASNGQKCHGLGDRSMSPGLRMFSHGCACRANATTFAAFGSHHCAQAAIIARRFSRASPGGMRPRLCRLSYAQERFRDAPTTTG
jgi:hypothetical protein